MLCYYNGICLERMHVAFGNLFYIGYVAYFACYINPCCTSYDINNKQLIKAQRRRCQYESISKVSLLWRYSLLSMTAEGLHNKPIYVWRDDSRRYWNRTVVQARNNALTVEMAYLRLMSSFFLRNTQIKKKCWSNVDNNEESSKYINNNKYLITLYNTNLIYS